MAIGYDVITHKRNHTRVHYTLVHHVRDVLTSVTDKLLLALHWSCAANRLFVPRKNYAFTFIYIALFYPIKKKKKKSPFLNLFVLAVFIIDPSEYLQRHLIKPRNGILVDEKRSFKRWAGWLMLLFQVKSQCGYVLLFIRILS